MSANAISGISTGTSSTALLDRMPVQKLGQEEFIKILVTQLTSQDPLNPQKDTEFIGQMAQFSQLESAKQMQTELQTMRANQLLGQTVEVELGDDQSLIGMVTAIDNVNGTPRIIVGDQSFELSDVTRLEQAGNPPTV